MKFSASSVLFPEIADRAEIARKVAQAGYEGIEWRVQTDYHIDPDRIGAEASELAAISRDSGLKVVCLATYIGWSEIDRIRTVARAARVLDCPRIRLAGFNYDGKEPYWTVYDRAVRQIEAAAPVLKEEGVKGVIETHFGTIHASAHGAVHLLRHFDPETIACILDGSNLIVEGWEDWKMVIECLGDYLDHVHARNAAWYKTQEKGWHWTWESLEDGIADWKRIFTILRERGYDGFVTNENILGVPTSSKGYIGEAHASLSGYEKSRTVEQRLADIEFLRRAAA